MARTPAASQRRVLIRIILPSQPNDCLGKFAAVAALQRSVPPSAGGAGRNP